ncbi:hypothetical protein LZZ85_22225 [Terrimonas sp. NA20]|uniref:Uncharacterized protein n=1 Tax=Terrimonas ginsenosidimutans TaxID=2908004 RepID=A0ABS9KXF8_9BACT|nr:hypothetical protein [Terrimonas ginsenosidimutans]MCG2617029.1 hypothetical protein [Terrimonas ginsenosidimutans]
MKKLCGLFLTALILLYSCQKESSFENGAGLSAEGSLQADGTGDCLPKNVLGIYEAGTELIATDNVIEVQVDVEKTGPYFIKTDTVNGYSFSARGNFSATGLTTVTLQGSGTPEFDGIDNFLVVFDSTECIVPVSVLPAGGAVPAEMTFTGVPGTCMDYIVNGDYVVNTALGATNTVDVKVNVTVAGTYTITTQASNGMTFTSSGTILTGVHLINLKGSGTPAVASLTTIPVTYDGANCSFDINVLATAPVDKDYFPRKPNSNWSYDIDDNADSILLTAKSGANSTVTTPGGTVYNIFTAKDEVNNFVDFAGYNKSGSDYYTINDVGYLLDFDDSGTAQLGEFIFLKHNANVGSTWYSPVFTGLQNGVTVRARIKFTILQKDVSVAVTTSEGAFTYPNTIVVNEQNEYEQGATWVEYEYFYRNYYSLDIGKVQVEGFLKSAPAAPGYKEELRRYQIAP